MWEGDQWDWRRECGSPHLILSSAKIVRGASRGRRDGRGHWQAAMTVAIAGGGGKDVEGMETDFRGLEAI